MHSRKPCMGLLGAFSVIEEEEQGGMEGWKMQVLLGQSKE